MKLQMLDGQERSESYISKNMKALTRYYESMLIHLNSYSYLTLFPLQSTMHVVIVITNSGAVIINITIVLITVIVM